MDNNIENFEQKYLQIFKPLKDLTLSFDINIDALISNYIKSIHDTVYSLNGSCSLLNFTEAAYILRHAADIYGQKVEYLYQIIQEFMNDAKVIKKSTNKNNETMNRTSSLGRKKFESFDEINNKTNIDSSVSFIENNYIIPLYIRQPTMLGFDMNCPNIDDSDIANCCINLQLFTKDNEFLHQKSPVKTCINMDEKNDDDDYYYADVMIENDEKINNVELSVSCQLFMDDDDDVNNNELEPIHDVEMQHFPKRDIMTHKHTIKNQPVMNKKIKEFEILNPDDNLTISKKMKHYIPKMLAMNKRKELGVFEDNLTQLLSLFYPQNLKCSNIKMDLWKCILIEKSKQRKTPNKKKILKSVETSPELARNTLHNAEDGINYDYDDNDDLINLSNKDDIDDDNDGININMFDDIFLQNDDHILELKYKNYEEINTQLWFKYMKDAEGVLVKSELDVLIRDWEEKIVPKLEEESQRRPFDIHVYASEIICKLVRHPNSKKKKVPTATLR